MENFLAKDCTHLVCSSVFWHDTKLQRTCTMGVSGGIEFNFFGDSPLYLLQPWPVWCWKAVQMENCMWLHDISLHKDILIALWCKLNCANAKSLEKKLNTVSYNTLKSWIPAHILCHQLWCQEIPHSKTNLWLNFLEWNL